jgi:hypothetical protein
LIGILPRLLDRDEIGANDLFFSQELRYHYILRSVHVVLIYLKLAAYRFPRCVLVIVMMIY